MNQTTIKYPVSIQGISLHSGKTTSVKISPAKKNSGIKFYLHNKKEHKIVPLTALSVINTNLSTNIGKSSCSVSTIEHLMSVLHGLSIDNVDISVQGDSLPILDGSAEPYYHLLKSAGIQKQQATRKYLIINEFLSVKEKDSYISISPYDGLIIDMTIKFKHPCIGTQALVFDLLKDDYLKEIALARTFGIKKDIEKALEAGLIKGGSFDNAIVLDNTKIINGDLRINREFVRHKILDLLGDIYVCGPIKGYFEVCCGSHNINNKMMKLVKNS